MPLQINTLSTSTPFLQSYQPYEVPPNTQLAEVVENMISYDVFVNGNPVNLTYLIGAENTYLFSILLKNITTNVILDVEIQQDTPIFVINTRNVFSLAPGQIEQIDLELNKEYLNSTTTIFEFLATMNIRVSNRTNGTVSLVDLTTDRFAQQQLADIFVD
jgi:hypothetical protein